MPQERATAQRSRDVADTSDTEHHGADPEIAGVSSLATQSVTHVTARVRERLATERSKAAREALAWVLALIEGER